jgi:chromosome condensin MukBEF MukE localization factor
VVVNIEAPITVHAGSDVDERALAEMVRAELDRVTREAEARLRGAVHD